MVAPLVESTRLGLRHFGPVVLSAGMLRLMAGAIQITFVIAPVAVADYVVPAQLPGTVNAPWIGPVCRLASGVGGALVGAVLIALCNLYDARLFAVLQHMETGDQAASTIR